MRILIMGGNRFFGRRLAKLCVDRGDQLTLLNRGNLDDGLGGAIKRIRCDRSDPIAVRQGIGSQEWDIVYDQICYYASEAQAACEIFAGRCQRYIFTSTQSVYGPGAALKESAVDSLHYTFTTPVYSKEHYGEGKRQAEAVFHQYAKFPVTSVRIPMIQGADDVTRRFHFHIEHIRNRQPIFMPNPNARVSLFSSAATAAALLQLAEIHHTGPINVCAPEPIAVGDFVKRLEEILQQKAVWTVREDKTTASPYGIQGDWYMDTGLAASLGIKMPPIESWLQEEALKV